MSNQFGRKASLIVSTGTQGLDLSQFRFTFRTTNSDAQTPNTLYVRVYNLSPQTVAKIGTEFNTITLQAGYEAGNFGIIFQGSIKQTATGRERNVDSYVDIWGADGDDWFNFSVISQSLSAGQTPQQVISAITGAASSNGTPPVKLASDAGGLIAGSVAGTAQALSRGKVMFGMSRDYARDWSNKYGFRWSIQNGQFVLVPITGYRPGEAVVLSSTTGLIGVPEATQDGVRVRALLNPLIRIGCLVQIAQSDINQITTQQQGLTYNAAIATVVTAAGFYRAMTAEFSGDSRGRDWYVDMICLAVDVSASNQSQSVAASG
ncbi:phage protein [Paraburkholderia sediminicola]|uniref:phage protein n=1 Tax=Paraburkholderia sediminicola TaxID=458836 RepID=UPI0038B9F8F4